MAQSGATKEPDGRYQVHRQRLAGAIPLLAGVVAALVAANVAPAWYHGLVHESPFEGKLLGHPLTITFAVNDLFMVLFFGLAAKEIVVALRPGGSLHPARRAANPIIASLGGVVAPAAVYVALIHGLFQNVPDHDVLMGAWAIPTATDIALVWLVARAVFGNTHPAVDFLLLLAIVDDLIGIGIIAIVYPGETTAAGPAGWLVILSGICVAWILRRAGVRSWLPYVLGATPIVWVGLLLTPLHPSLALVPVVPFLPEGSRNNRADGHGTTAQFERAIKPVVDHGLFFFGFANAGVQLGDVMFVTWVVFAALVLGKTAGIGLCSLGAAPAGMGSRDVFVVGLLASIGLTIALFITGRAFPLESPYQGAARMGALFSLGVAGAAIAWARVNRSSRRCA